MIWKILKSAAVLTVAGILALWIDHSSETVLPTPSGPYPVGRSIQDWRDEASAQPATRAGVVHDKADAHELLAWIWYPAAAPSSLTDDYLPSYTRAAFQEAENPVFEALFRDRSKVRDHTLRDAAISMREPSYPVIVFRGGASAEVVGYSVLAEDLASHGYIVVGLDAPYRTGVVAFPDGRVIRERPENNVEFCQQGGEADSPCIDKILRAWTADIAFAADRLTSLNGSDRFAGHLDLTHLGLFGHSFGGAQAAQFCHDDPRCKAAIDLDGLVFANFAREGAGQPFMFVFSDQINSAGDEPRRARAQFDRVYDRLPSGTRARFYIRGSNHFLFSEGQAFLASHIVMRTLRGLGIVGIDGPRQIAATACLVHTFFDIHLKHQNPALLASASELYPEIRTLP